MSADSRLLHHQKKEKQLFRLTLLIGAILMLASSVLAIDQSGLGAGGHTFNQTSGATIDLTPDGAFPGEVAQDWVRQSGGSYLDQHNVEYVIEDYTWTDADGNTHPVKVYKADTQPPTCVQFHGNDTSGTYKRYQWSAVLTKWVEVGSGTYSA